MIQDFKTQLDEKTPSALRRHRHKLMVLGLSVVGTALFLQFAATPSETTAAVHVPQDAQVVNAMVPLGEVFGYATQLRSISQGRAIYTMQFSHYNPVPDGLANELLEKIRG